MSTKFKKDKKIYAYSDNLEWGDDVIFPTPKIENIVDL